MKSKLAAAVLVVLLALLAGWWYFSPYLAVRGMQQAAQAGDATAFNAHVDYPRLRQNLKIQLSDLLAQKLGASNGSSPNPLAALGGMIGQRLIDPLVEGLVRPETVMAAMQNGRLIRPGAAAPSASMPAPADPAGVPATPAPPGSAPPADAGAAPPVSGPAAPAPPAADAKPRWQIQRDGFNRMTAYALDPERPDGPESQRLGLVFERSGFVDWKLTDIRLPAFAMRGP